MYQANSKSFDPKQAKIKVTAKHHILSRGNLNLQLCQLIAHQSPKTPAQGTRSYVRSKMTNLM